MNLKEAKYNYLLQQHKNNIYGYALYMMKNQMDADDVTQEVMIKTWYNMGKFNMMAAKTWMMRTTHNLCIDYLRRRKAVLQKEVVIDEGFTENYLDEDESNNPLLKVHWKMMSAKLKQVIHDLPENLKSVFVLYEIQGLKYKEISKTLDVPINTVKVQLLRARKKIQKELKSYEPQEVL
ncbi:MAG: RNA polymerase sigma factor [Melioribacteraceae bacterium]|nr:RNA polymerase sigma factor [Melioribacteraceae bacterium]